MREIKPINDNFKNQSLPFKMFVGFHILTFIIVYILIIVGRDKWFSSKGNKLERRWNSSPPFNIPLFALPKMIDYDNEFISVWVWTGYIVGYWLGVNLGGGLLAIWTILCPLLFFVIIPILDILWCCFDCLIRNLILIDVLLCIYKLDLKFQIHSLIFLNEDQIFFHQILIFHY